MASGLTGALAPGFQVLVLANLLTQEAAWWCLKFLLQQVI